MRYFFLFSLLFSLNTTFSQCDTTRYTEGVFTSVTQFPDVLYGQAQVWNIPYNDTDLYMDIYVPTGDVQTKRPLMIWCHPGGFLLGDKSADDMVALCDSFARKGFVTASIGYRKGFNPLSQSSAVRAVYRGTQDARAAIRYLKEFATTYGIDTNYTFVGGSSAGGFMALHTAYLTDAEAPSDIQGGFGYPALGCLDCSGNTYSHNMDLTGIINLWGALGDSNYVEINETVPALLIHGEADGTVPIGTGNPFGVFTTPIVNGSRPISNQLTSLGIPHTFLPFAGQDHEFHGADNGTFNSPPNAYWDTILNAIQSHVYPLLKPENPSIAGDLLICLGETVTYVITGNMGEIYCSEVTNGTLISDWGDSIQVQWNTIGVGEIKTFAFNSIHAASDKVIYQVNVVPLPDATFTAGINGLIVNFNPNTLVLSSQYTWQIDASIVNTSNTIYSFTTSGTYPITLTIVDTNMCSSTSTQTLVLTVNSLTENYLNNVVLYPNPANDFVSIENGAGGNLIVQDHTGRVVLNKKIQSENHQVDISALNSGLYFVKIVFDGAVKNARFIKN